MISQKKFIDLSIILFFFLFLIMLKNYLLCDIFSDCSLMQEKFIHGDLSKYILHYNSGRIVNQYNIGAYSVFKLFHTWVSFKFFLIIFQLSFYSIIFFSALNSIENENLLKFFFFTLVVAFYPFYDGYSAFSLKQGLGMIFLFISIFLVKRVFSLISCIFIIFSILSHYVFLTFYLTFFISRYFSLKLLIFLYLLTVPIYSLNINDSWYLATIGILYDMNLFFVHENLLSKFYSESKLRFILFSSLPLLSFLIPGFKKLLHENELLKNLYQCHFLHSSIIYLFLSEFFYIDRFLSLTWIFYPFYFLYILRLVKFNKTWNKPKFFS